ncbi:two-component sensor histidine kinase [Micrococcus flavus]|uniref:histidine kinase n=1 Tax=Micrococcus flavus TaxID=384602 RepID=A0A4Y8WWI4_9MICC|nr:histidine kinase [Micrococcus flavus]MBB4881677.1 signal transduction histidine kinase [Micrococcus flavus]TFH98662.1 two-component sensor histidine kinase [Micrococcus flavus]GGK54852.1 two-component sensor histidine kinase [Micrococcus flavus]
MNPLRRVDHLLRRHPVRADAITAAVLALVLVVVPWFVLGYVPSPSPEGTRALVAVLTGFGLTLPWAARRRWPMASAGVTVLAALVHLAFGPEFSAALVMVPLTVYNLAALAPRRASIAGLLAGLAGGAANGMKVWLFPPAFTTPDGLMIRSPADPAGMVVMTVGCGLTVLTAWAFGDVVRNRRLAVQALEDRTRRLETQALQERELAAADERSHIAREMHDIVAHSLQVIISQSDGARYAAAAKPELAVATLETIGQTGRAALADMRQLLGVLRGPADAGADRGRRDPASRDAHRAPPGLADVPDLLATMRLSGLEVSLLEQGSPRRALPGGGLTAYRVVQEALTNTLRHASPDARSFVSLAWTPHGLDVQVDDDSRGAAADPATAGSGQGLRGIAERVALFGGTVETGPRVGAGYRVHAHLPYTEI